MKDMTVERYVHMYLLKHPELFKDNIIPKQLLTESSEEDNNFKHYVLSALKNLKSKLKTLTIVVDDSKNLVGIQFTVEKQKLWNLVMDLCISLVIKLSSKI
jgi:hypothetical protein